MKTEKARLCRQPSPSNWIQLCGSVVAQVSEWDPFLTEATNEEWEDDTSGDDVVFSNTISEYCLPHVLSTKGALTKKVKPYVKQGMVCVRVFVPADSSPSIGFSTKLGGVG